MKLFNSLYYYLLAGCIISAVSSCSNLRYLPKGEVLYTGAQIKVEDRRNDVKTPNSKKKDIRSGLAAMARPKPNRKLLGMRIRLYAYNIAGNPKKETSLRGRLKYRFGEPPVLLSDVNLDKNVQIQESYLQNKGYFKAHVRGDTTIRGKKATATYRVRPQQQYVINEVAFQMDSAVLGKTILETVPKTLLKKGAPFDLDIITLERQRIDAHLKENGFYFFNPDNLIIKVDSTIGNATVNLYVQVKPAIPEEAREVYRIRDVYIFTNFSLNAATSDTLKKDAEYHSGFYLVDKRKYFKPKLFEKTMQFQPGDIYSRKDHNETLSRLINLNLFKFTKNRFEVADNADSAQLDAYYYLTRLPRKSMRVEINANTKSNNLTGTELSVSWRNRNTFRAGELLSIRAYGGAEIQYSGQLRGYNTYRTGIEATMSIPRFVIPFFDLNTKGSFVPKTNIMLGYDILNKRKLYTMNSFKAQFGYVWKENIRKEHELNPISITYVQPILVTPEYSDSANKYPTLKKAIERQFILGSNYTYTVTNVLSNVPANGFYFRGGIDLSGNIAGLVTSANARKLDTVKIFNAPFSQYVKLEGDYRLYRKISPKSVWVNRINIGVGIPYGNSGELPFIKQFFSGGNNSVRAFRSRSLGPGSYVDTAITTFLPDQSGDIKLELNTEFRFNIVAFINGAVFVDAGNIWLFNDNKLKPGAKFTNKFFEEIAVGAGVGLRFDFNLLVLRLDLATPLRKPWLVGPNRWVIKDIDFSNPPWRRKNLVLNIAIGYPF
jgi:outer membrane protein insertion porin family